jgi:transposase-like protein
MCYLFGMDKKIKKDGPKTLLQATRYFADPDVCLDWMVQARWPDGVTCPRCGGTKVGFLAKDRRWKCYTKHTDGQPQKFSAKVGTIFEDSPIGLDKWFVAMWLLGNCKNGISSYELARDIQVTQKTGWFMLQRIRLAMQQGTFDTPLGDGGGEVEADETFIGGLARNMHKHRRAKAITGTGGAGKAVVMGLIDRKTRKVRVKHVPNRQAKTLQGFIKLNVRPGAGVITDEFLSYTGLDKEYIHNVINHAESYVKGSVHTNGMENFWSLLKRGLKGTYISVEPFHLFRYIDEQAFRFNERRHDDGDSGRFGEMLSEVVGKRLTYTQLTGKESALTAATV